MPDLKVTDDSPQRVGYFDELNSPDTSAYTLPRVAGSSGQVITIDANGDCNFQSVGDIGTLGSIEFRATPYFDDVNAAADNWSPSGKTITPEVIFNLSVISYSATKANNTWRYDETTGLTFSGGTEDTGVSRPALGFATHSAGNTNPNVTGNFIFTDSGGTDHTFSFRIDWILIQEGAAGSDGAAGTAARGVTLTASDQSIEYNKDGTTPNPSSVTVFAEAVNASETDDVYFEFFIDDVSQGAPAAAGNDSPFAAQITIASPTTIGSPKKVECQIREGGASNPILARDQIVIFPLKQGSDAITIILSNEAHTLPTTNSGTVTYTDSGTDIEVYEGTNQLGYDGTSPYPNSTYRVSAVGTNVTVSTPTTVTDTSPLDLYSPQTGYVRRYGDHSNMTADNASIEYTITVKNDEGVERTFIKKQSLAKSVQGAEGSAGSDGRTVTLSAGDQLFDYDTNGANPTGKNSGNNQTTITAEARNTTGTLYYEFFVDDTSVQLGSSNTYTYTAQADIANMPDKIEVELREGNNSPQSVVARDQFTVFGLQPGSSAITIAMSNEAHSIRTGPTGDSPSATYPNSGTTFDVFEGNTQLDYDDSVPYAVGTYRISADISPTSDITIGTASTAANGKTRIIGDHSNMVNADDQIVYEVTVKRADGTETTFTRTQTLNKSEKGETGEDGADAKTVRLTADDYVIEYDQSGKNPTPASTITLTGTAQNFVDPYFKFTGDGITDETVYTDGTGDSDTFSFSVPADYTSTPKTLRVGVAEASADTVEIAFDSITIAAVKEGSGNIGAFLSNDSHVFPASSSGAVSSYSGSGTRIEVYEGAVELDYDGVGTSAGTFSVSASGTNITPGSITEYDSPPLNSPEGYKAFVEDHTGVADGIDTSTIVYTISGTRGNGDAFSVTKNQTFSKSKSGTDGTNGTDGTDAAAVKLIADTHVIPYATAGDESPETSVGFTTEIQSITNPYYEFYVNKLDGSGDVEKQAISTTSTFTLADGDEPAIGKSVTVKVKVYEGNSPIAEGPVAIDSVSVYAVQSGSDAVIGFLTNAAHVAVADSSGTVSSFSGAGGTYKVFVGNTDVTTSCTFSVSSETGVDVSIGESTGVNSPAGASTGVYTVSSMSADQGTATFQAVIPAAIAGASSDVTITADYSISKSIEGSAGTDGIDGTDGKQNASGLVYYTVAQASNPGAPSATSYNFSTRAFTGLTSNWQTTPVEVEISDTTTKYWTSRYDVTETTAGGGTGTPSFDTPTGSINFGANIQSDNYVAGTSGWQIQRDTGDAEFNNVNARGALLGGKDGPRDYINYNSPLDSPLPHSETVSTLNTGFYIGPDDSPEGSGSYDFIIGDSTNQLRFDGSSGELDIRGAELTVGSGQRTVKIGDNNIGIGDNFILRYLDSPTADTRHEIIMSSGAVEIGTPTAHKNVIVTPGEVRNFYISSATATYFANRISSVVEGTANTLGITIDSYGTLGANQGIKLNHNSLGYYEGLLATNDSGNLKWTIGDSSVGTSNAKITGGLQITGAIIDSTGDDGDSGYVPTADGSGGWAWAAQTGAGGSVTGSGTANKIAKWSGSSALTDSLVSDDGTTVSIAANDFTVDTDTLFVDVSEDRVGINDSTPSYSLDVNGTGRITGVLRLDSNSAQYGGAYDIYRSGAGYLRHRIADQTLSIGVTNTAGTVHYPIQMVPSTDTLIFNNEDGEMARFDTAGDFLVDTDTLYVDVSADRVGINDSTPSYSLDVNGTGRFTTSLRVKDMDISGWTTSSDVDGLLTGSTTGMILEGPANAHVVVGLRENDAGDSFSIISGGGNYQTDSTYDTLVAHFGSDGKVGIGMESAGQVFEVAGAIKGAASANSGDAFYIGNDTKLVDIDVANVGAIYGTSDTSIGGLKFGSGGGTIYGASSNIGITQSSPQANLDVGGSGTSDICLQLRSGDGSGGTDSSQIVFAYNGASYNSSGYAHSIRTRHNSASDDGNAIDFWLWDQGTDTASTLGSKRVMTIEGTGRVGIGTDDPSDTLHVSGIAKVTSAVLTSFMKSGNGAGNLTLQGGNSGGANIELYGESHSSFANDAYYDADVHNFRSASAATDYATFAFAEIDFTRNLNMNNYNITGVNQLAINDPGPNEGIVWSNGNGWSIYESPDDLTTNSAGNLQFVDSGSRIFTLNTSGNGDFTGGLNVDGSLNVKIDSDAWTTSTWINVSDYGVLNTGGSYALTLNGNGYRNNSGQWTSFSANSLTGATQIWQYPAGYVTINANSSWASGSSSSVTERVRFFGNGQVGIGTTSIAATEASTGTLLCIDGGISLEAGDGRGLKFWDNNSNAYGLWMSSQGNATYGGRLDSTSDYNLYFNMSSGTNRGFVFKNNGTAKAQIDGGGNIFAVGDVTAFVSDERLKTRIDTIDNAVEKVRSLNGFIYKFNDTAKDLGYDTEKRQVGLSAQEVEKVLPEVIKPAPVDNEYKTLDYAKVVPLLVEAIKEQQEQIENLQKKLEEMSK